MRQSPDIAFRGELERKWELININEPLYTIAFISLVLSPLAAFV